MRKQKREVGIEALLYFSSPLDVWEAERKYISWGRNVGFQLTNGTMGGEVKQFHFNVCKRKSRTCRWLYLEILIYLPISYIPHLSYDQTNLADGNTFSTSMICELW